MALLDKAYILAAVRTLLNEVSSVTWTDDQINKWVQEAAMDISIKTLGYEDTDDITTTANTFEYSEPSGCIKVHSCVKAESAWTQYFDDNYWESRNVGGCVWDDSEPGYEGWYHTGAHQVDLDVIGTWADGYRPSKIRVSWVGGNPTINIKLGYLDGDGTLVSDAAYSSGDELVIDWSAGYDLDTLMDLFELDFVSNIEFYPGPGTDYKGLSQIHPRLIHHVAHNETGEPIHYYHHHQKVGFWPLPDDTYTVKVFSSKVTEDITDLPTELRLLAIPYCLARARLPEGWEDDFEMFITMYLNSVMAHRRDKGQYRLDTIDAQNKFRIPEGKVVNA